MFKKGFTLIELLVTIAIIGLLVSIVTVSVNQTNACGWFTDCNASPSATEQKKIEQESVAQQLDRLTNATPIPHLDQSLERTNIASRLQVFSDPAKISYIYLTSFGKVMAYYTVKGKITSGSKRLTASEQFVNCDGGQYNQDCPTEAPELDGTYGHSSDYIYFWTTDGTYVQWNGEYMLSDQPLKLSTQPELIRTIK